jgi:predicted acyltransferase
MEQVKTQRYIALDVLRGMTVAGMITVNNPGSWAHVFPPLRHALWAGCTPTDLVFPFFLFVVGAAMAFSFAKYNESLSGKSVRKLIKRGLLIILVGLALNAFPFYPLNPNPVLSCHENYMNYLQHIRLFGVLIRIGFCYMVGGMLALWLKEPKKIIPAMALLIAAEWIILAITGDASSPMVNGAKGIFSAAGQGSGMIDIKVVGESHVYHGEGFPFDPEGLLGILTGSCTVLLGFMIGNLVRKAQDKIKVVTQLYTIGLICLALGLIISIWQPIIKALWTGSYVLYAGGWAIIMLAFFIYFIDVKGKVKAFTPFRALGMNPLFAFVMAAFFVKILGMMIHWTSVTTLTSGAVGPRNFSVLTWFYQYVCVGLIGKSNEISSLLFALCYVAVFTAMAYWLYKKHIVIKL